MTTGRWGEFRVVPENRAAVRAVRGIARSLLAGRRPRVVPVVVHGPPGVGKSALVGALAAELTAAGDLTVQVVPVGDLARVVAGTDGFADPDLAACDLLALEDVQLLPPREAGAVAGLLDRRASRRRAVVVTANAGPAGLRHLPARLTSRLAAGLVVPLEPLGAASRRAILADAATARGVRLTPDALDALAARPTGGGVRPLLGVLGNLAAGAGNYPGPLDRTAADEILAGTGQPTSAGPDAAGIIRKVAAAFGVTERELVGVSRLRRVLVPRQVAMYLVRVVCGLSLPRVGAAFGKDHATVLHACRKVEADEGLRGRVDRLRQELS